MSLNSDVLAELEELGVASCDDIAPLLPEYTREQVKQSLQNLKFTGRAHIVVASRGLGQLGGKTPARYAASMKVAKVEPQAPRPFNSVWELGTRALETA